MISIRSRRRTAGAVIALGLSVSACATDDPLFWDAVSLAVDIAAYDAMLDNCSWYSSPHGGTYQLCGDHRPDPRPPHRPPHRPHRPGPHR